MRIDEKGVMVWASVGFCFGRLLTEKELDLVESASNPGWLLGLGVEDKEDPCQPELPSTLE